MIKTTCGATITPNIISLKETVNAIQNSYELYISNKTNKALKVVLFSEKYFFNSENFGSDEGVYIKSMDEKKDYKNILTETKTDVFTCPYINIQSESISQLDNNINISKNEIERYSFKPSDYKSPISDLLYDIGVFIHPDFENIDSNYKIEFNILPKNKMIMTFYKKIKWK